MNSEKEMESRIAEAAREEFFQHGFSKVTVDEIAAKLGISKKTIYKFFESKEVLVAHVARRTMEEMASCCKSIVDEEGVDFVERLRRMMTTVAIQYSKLGKPLIEDLQKHAPHVWNQIAEFRSQQINKEFGALLKEGMAKKKFRSDIDQRLILLIYANAMQTIITPEMLLHLPFSATQIFETIIKVIFEGILTEEAKPEYLARPSYLSLAQQRI